MILDTCALLWLAQGGGPLSANTLAAIQDAREVAVCAISAFEIGLKASRGQLVLPASPRVWFAGVTRHHALAVLPLDAEVCCRASELPPVHRDPCDRFIIATALAGDRAVVTHDRHFSAYGITVLG